MPLLLCMAAFALFAGKSAWTQPAAEQQNILLLSVDTLRADRLGCYGYPLNTSPNLDRFAQSALLFEDCVCNVPLTNPSMGSMFTSRYPRMNGTTRNGLRLPENIPTITEQFKAAGFYTWCVQSNWTLKRKLSGMHRGFDVYEDDFHEKRWGFIKPERSADKVTRVALEQLAKRPKDRPFFAWVHYTDPHAPYKMHKGFNPSGKKAWTQGRQGQIRTKYDSEVAFTDAEIGKLLAALPDNTAVVFTADHGESLFEHDYLGHGRRIYQHELHIPFVVRAAGVTPGRSAAPAAGIDIGPTLLGLAGLAKTAGMLGVDALHDTIAADRVRFVETYGGAVPHLPGAKALMAGAKPIRQGVLRNGWKLILDGRHAQLFHLPEDYEELHDAAARHETEMEELRGLLSKWDQNVTHKAAREAELNQDDLDALKALGYLE